MTEVACVLPAGALLGEGPHWDRTEQALYWVDIKGCEVHRFDPVSGRDRRWPTPEPIGSLAVRAQGGLVLALRSRFHFLDLDTGRVTPVVRPEPDRPENPFNDDAEGFVWLAHWGGWRLTRYDPTGRAERVIRLTVEKPTCPPLGGPDLDVLYVTSASIGLTPEDRVSQPWAGGILALDPGVRGRPEARFAG